MSRLVDAPTGWNGLWTSALKPGVADEQSPRSAATDLREGALQRAGRMALSGCP